MNKAIEDAAEKYVEVYHLHDCKWSIKEIYKDGAFAPETEQYYREKFQAEQKPIGNVWVDVKELPEIAQLDQVINTYVHAHGSESYKHIQERFWIAINAINKANETPAPTDEEIEKGEVQSLLDTILNCQFEIIINALRQNVVNVYDIESAFHEYFGVTNTPKF